MNPTDAEPREKLLPCPFCGGPAEHDSKRWDGIGAATDGSPHVGHAVYCAGECFLPPAGGCPQFETKGEAIAAWNRRITPPSPDAGTGTPETDEALKQTSVLVNYAPSFIAFARSLESRLAAALADNAALRRDKERLDWLETQDCWIGLKGHSDARPIHAAGGGYTQKVREVADKLRAARAAKSEGGE